MVMEMILGCFHCEIFMTGGCRREDEGLNTAVLTLNGKETMAEGLLSRLACSSHRLHRRTLACANGFKAKVSIAA